MDRTAKERMRRYRAKTVTDSVTKRGSVTTQSVTVERAAELLMVCRSLDKEVRGLDGESVNLLTMVRYGVSGPTMDEVNNLLSIKLT